MVKVVFGAIGHLNNEEGSFAFFIVIGCVVMIETFFHHVHLETHDTPFSDMVHAIEKELMIVGCMAFGLKLLLNTTNFINHDWLLGVEFADLTVPFTSFIYCIIGLILIVLSRSHIRTWIVSYHLSLVELLDSFLLERKAAEDWGGLYKYVSDFFGSEVGHQMEFRIVHNIFCEAYAIQRKAFAFDGYAKRCYEKYLLSLVTISPLSWFMIALMVLSNYVRNRVSFQIYYCAGTPLPHHPHFSSTAEQVIAEASAQEFETCAAKRALLFYTFMGICLLITTAIMAVFSRLYLRAIMAARGVYSVDDYANFLQILESYENVNLEAEKLTAVELKSALFTAKSKLDLQEAEKQIERSEKYTSMMTMVPKLITRSTSNISKIFNLGDSSNTLSSDLQRNKSDVASVSSRDGIFDASPMPTLREEGFMKADKDGDNASTEDQDVEAGQPPPPAATLSRTSSGRIVQRKTSVKFDVSHLRKNNSSSSMVSDLAGEVAGSSSPPVPSSPSGAKMPHYLALGPIDSTIGPPPRNLPPIVTISKPTPIVEVSESDLSECSGVEGFNSPARTRGGGFVISSTSTKEREKRKIAREEEQEANPPKQPMLHMTKALSRRTLIERNETHRKDHQNTDARVLAASETLQVDKHSRHKSNFDASLKSVFLFESPELFFTLVDTMIMLISFYIALWLSNFQFSASQMKENSTMWQIVPILPGILSTIIFTYLVKNSAFMHAVVVLDPDVVEETIEKDITSKLLAQQLREKLLNLLDENSEESAEVQLKDLFSIIDADGSACLSRFEMKQFLQSMKVTFSKIKWNQMFMEMDRNFDDQITFDELLLFVFPNHDVAQEAERKRLSIIGNRVVSLTEAVGHNDAAFEASKKRIVSMNNVSVKNHRRSSLFSSAVSPSILKGNKKIFPGGMGRPSIVKETPNEDENDTPDASSDIKISGKTVSINDLIKKHKENQDNEGEISSESSCSSDADDEGVRGIRSPSQIIKKSKSQLGNDGIKCKEPTIEEITKFDHSDATPERSVSASPYNELLVNSAPVTRTEPLGCASTAALIDLTDV